MQHPLVLSCMTTLSASAALSLFFVVEMTALPTSTSQTAEAAGTGTTDDVIAGTTSPLFTSGIVTVVAKSSFLQTARHSKWHLLLWQVDLRVEMGCQR